MTQRTPEREQFLKDVLITAVEGGINYWAAVSEYEPEKGTVTVWEDVDDDGTFGKAHLVTIDTIAHGIQVLTTGENAGKAFCMGSAEYWKQFLLANRTNSEDGDYDADIADNVLQAGLFDSIVYG